jgi:hypothetical protein
MKKLALAAVLAVTASTAFAGGLTEPAPEQSPAVVEKQAATSGGILIPLLLLIVIGAAVAAN